VENQKKKKRDGNLGDSARGQVDLGSASVYTMACPDSWSDRGSAVILPDPMHKKYYIIFCVLIAAREWLSFTRRTHTVHPSQQKYRLFAVRRSREGKLYP
jgi:hypothetical protein